MARRTPATAGLTATLAALVLAACGSTPAPGGGGTRLPDATVGPSRPVTAQPVAADGALECPATLASAEPTTVPQKPQGVDGNARLLPDRAATSMVVCGYPVMDVTGTKVVKAPFARSTRTVASPAQRAQVVELLAWAPRWNGRPRACTMMAGNETAYLVGAVYDGAIVWVAAKADANSCSTATNGDFVAGEAVGVPLDALFGERAPQPTPDQPCVGRIAGRLGDDRSLAPEGDPVVTVCRLAADSTWRPTRLDTTHSAEVVAALRALATRPTDGACQAGDKAFERAFSLALDYDRGPSVRVNVAPECTPTVLGGNLEADDADTLVSLVESLSPPIPGPDPDGSVSSGGSSGSAGGGSGGGAVGGSPDATPMPLPPDATPGDGMPGNTGIEPAPPATQPVER